MLISPAMAIGSAYYRPLVEQFESHGWDARALTRRGFEPELPTASREHDWSYADEIQDIADAVEQARTENPQRPVLVLGHSLGGQLVAGHEATQAQVDGVITVGASLPWFRGFPYGGMHLALLAGLFVPATTTIAGHLPKPFFGAPGARTMMREWARMVLTGRPPFHHDHPLSTPALVISLEDDNMSPHRAVDDLACMFTPETTTRWHYRHVDVPAGASNDHIRWVRNPQPVVDRIIDWWTGLPADEAAGPT